MSRIRSIKPDFWSSEQVMALSRDARLLFIGMWNFADDHGRMKLNPTTIKAQVFPGDDDATRDRVEGWLREIIAQGLLHVYRRANTPEGAPGPSRELFAYVTGWPHQRVSHPMPSKLPDPKSDLVIPASFATEAPQPLRTDTPHAFATETPRPFAPDPLRLDPPRSTNMSTFVDVAVGSDEDS